MRRTSRIPVSTHSASHHRPIGKHLRISLRSGYLMWITCLSGSVLEEPPARKVYSPGSSCQAFCWRLKMERYCGSTSIVISLLSPGESLTLRQPTSLLGGSPADGGSEAYTSAISEPARLPE